MIAFIILPFIIIALAIATDNTWIADNFQYANGNLGSIIDQNAVNNAAFNSVGQVLIQTNIQDASFNTFSRIIQKATNDANIFEPMPGPAFQINRQTADSNFGSIITQEASNVIDFNLAANQERKNTQDKLFKKFEYQALMDTTHSIEESNVQMANFNVGSFAAQEAFNAISTDFANILPPRPIKYDEKEIAAAFSAIEQRSIDADRDAKTHHP